MIGTAAIDCRAGHFSPGLVHTHRTLAEYHDCQRENGRTVASDNVDAVRTMLRYLKARRQPFYATHLGVGVDLIAVSEDGATGTVERMNGARRDVPLAEITF